MSHASVVRIDGILNKVDRGQSLTQGEQIIVQSAGGPEGLREARDRLAVGETPGQAPTDLSDLSRLSRSVGVQDPPEPPPVPPADLAGSGGIGLPEQLDPYEIVPPRLRLPEPLDPYEVIPPRLPDIWPEGVWGMSDMGSPLDFDPATMMPPPPSSPPGSGNPTFGPTDPLSTSTFGAPYDRGDPNRNQSHVVPEDGMGESIITEVQDTSSTTLGKKDAGLEADGKSAKTWMGRMRDRLNPEDPDARRALATALMRGGRAMASAPGNALEGISAGLSGGLEGYYDTKDLTAEESRKEAELEMAREMMDLRREAAALARTGDARSAQRHALEMATGQHALDEAKKPPSIWDQMPEDLSEAMWVQRLAEYYGVPEAEILRRLSEHRDATQKTTGFDPSLFMGAQ